MNLSDLRNSNDGRSGRTDGILTAQYDVLAFTPEELTDLQQLLQSLGPTRVRPAYKERGGDETTLWVVLFWIGASYLSGIVGHVAGKNIELLWSKLREYFARHHMTEERTKQNIALCLSFDDLEIEINVPVDMTMAQLNILIQDVEVQRQCMPL
jgi:hypothetical protein